jgi:hypothetical protein
MGRTSDDWGIDVIAEGISLPCSAGRSASWHLPPMRNGGIRLGLAVSDDALGLQELMNTPIGVFASVA